MKIFFLISISVFITLLSLFIPAFAIPTDENSAILKSWVLPIPLYENNSFFAISTSFGGNNAYFVESNSNKIGRLVPATNTITEWSLQEKPAVINVDSAGSIHFIDKNGTRIYRLG
jgi:virginiamycin B lyase